MTTIPDSYTKYTHTRTLERRDGRVAMYKISRRSRFLGYEVVIVQQRDKPVTIGKSTLPAGEYLPASSMWGVFGWSFMPNELGRAEERYAKCCKQFNRRQPIRIERKLR